VSPTVDSCSFVSWVLFLSSEELLPGLMALQWLFRSPVPELLLGCNSYATDGIMPRNTVLPTFVMLSFSTFMSTWEIPLG